MESITILESLQTVLPILIIIGVGFFLKLTHVLSKSFAKEANHFAYVIGFPLLLFTSTVTADLKALLCVKMILYSLCSILIMAGVGYFIFRKVADHKKQGALVTATFRSDILLFATYITGKLFGSQGIALAAMLTAFISPTVTTLSIVILNHLDQENRQKIHIKQLLRQIISNPFIIAIVLGILVNCSGLSISATLLDPFSKIGSATIPLTLIAVGTQLDFKKTVQGWKYVAVGVTAKLVIVPVIFMTGAILLGFRGAEISCLFAQYAAPTTSSCYIFAEQMHSDADLAGNIVLFSTVFSTLTIFFGLIILGMLNLI